MCKPLKEIQVACRSSRCLWTYFGEFRRLFLFLGLKRAFLVAVVLAVFAVAVCAIVLAVAVFAGLALGAAVCFADEAA
jgi:hypothetical protein